MYLKNMIDEVNKLKYEVLLKCRVIDSYYIGREFIIKEGPFNIVYKVWNIDYTNEIVFLINESGKSIEMSFTQFEKIDKPLNLLDDDDEFSYCYL